AICGLLAFKSGEASGKHSLSLVLHPPTSKKQKVMEQEIELKGGANGGANVQINIGLGVKTPGLFWLDVVLDGRRFTRMPLLILFQRVPSLLSPPQMAEQSPGGS